MCSRLEGRQGGVVDGEVDALAAQRAGARARPVGGQLDGLEAGELPLPVSQCVLCGAAGKAAPLPQGVVGELEPGRSGGCGEGLAAQYALVEQRQLAREDAHRPAVGDRVVHDERQHVVVLRDAQQLRPEQRSEGQVEGFARELAQARFEDGLERPVGFGGQFEHREVHGQLCEHALHGHAVDILEGGAERRVAIDEGLQRCAQRGDVQLAGEAGGRSDAVNRAGAGELLDGP